MIYVDVIQNYPQCKLKYKDWCHMATNSNLSELHAMAARLGLRRAWFQNKPGHPHYDLTPAKRAQALTLGAQVVSTHELLRRCYPQTMGNLHDRNAVPMGHTHVPAARAAQYSRGSLTCLQAHQRRRLV